jgi:hypothetical protein
MKPENYNNIQTSKVLHSIKENFVNNGNMTYGMMASPLIARTKFEQEQYLKNIKSFGLRRCLSKFRTSCHDSEIERGRYKKLIPSGRQNLFLQ